jgi:hypothetical protein
MKQKKKLLIFTLAALLTTSVWADQAMTFSNGETRIALSQDGRNIKYLKVAGVKNHFKGDSSSSLWRLYLFDEKTKALNTYPLHGRRSNWQNKWKMGTAGFSSRNAKLVSKHWSDDKKLLTLEYSHPQAKVKMFFKINPHSIVWWGEFTNKGELPIYQFTTMDKLQLTYKQQNSFIMPGLSSSGIEYKTIKATVYDTVSAWDGFLCLSPKNLFSLYVVQAENGPLLGTYTMLRGSGAPTGTVAVSSSTLCFRKRGQSLKGVKLKIAAFKDLRSWADNYVHDNFPSIKKLNEKIPDAIRSKLKKAYLMPLIAGNMKKISKVIKKIPGTVILHTPAYKRPPVKGGTSWDAFPNYFPPNPKHGSMDDYRKLIAEARDNGHLFMPRNSFFYWANGTDADIKYGLKNLAKIRIDGKPRTAKWALPGYIVSPSSKIVLDLLHGYFKTWKKLGANIYFTNVIGAIGPHGNRYDFHPDAPAPDYYYEQIKKMMKWHGDQMPLLSEGAGAWQLPFQAGFCIHPDWDPTHSKIDFFKHPSRGKYVRFRHEIGTMLGHEYVKLYPHNTSGIGTDSIPRITFALLHGINPKVMMGHTKHLNTNNFRWMRTNAILAKTVFAPIYGARLEKYTRRPDGSTRAVYGKYTIIGNYSGKNYEVATPYPGTRIAPGGFLFYSPGKSTVAGYFTQFAGHLFKSPQMVIITRKNKTIKLYLPLSTTETILPVPLKNAQTYKAVLHNKDSNLTLQTVCAYDKLLIKIPAIPAKFQKAIPFLSIEKGQAIASSRAPICLQAVWKDSGKSTEYYVNKKDAVCKAVIRMENYGAAAKQVAISISGSLWGNTINQNITMNAPTNGVAEKVITLSGKGIADNTVLKITAKSFKPFQQATLTLKKADIPLPMSTADVKKIAPVVLEWNVTGGKALSHKCQFKSVDAKLTPLGWKLSGPKSKIILKSSSLLLNKTIFLECIFRLDKKLDISEFQLLHPLGKTGARTIELRYNTYFDAIRFLTVNNKGLFFDMTNFEQALTVGKWYHVVAWMKDGKQFLLINGNTLERKFFGKSLQYYRGPWQLGGGLDVTVAYLRIGGTSISKP